MARLLFPATSTVALIFSASLAAGGSFGGYDVNPVNDVVYEVVSEGAHGGAAFWCAAGEYVERELRKPAHTEIYVVRGEGHSETTNRRSSAQFTIEPQAAGVTPADSSGDLNRPNVGEHMSAGLARNFCSSG